MTVTAPSTRYRRDIDGLRALAVVPVVLFHAHVPGVAGGFVGVVYVFFVISGYLITTLILDDLHAGRFSLGAFDQRRIRRIFPALLPRSSASGRGGDRSAAAGRREGICHEPAVDAGLFLECAVLASNRLLLDQGGRGFPAHLVAVRGGTVLHLLSALSVSIFRYGRSDMPSPSARPLCFRSS